MSMLDTILGAFAPGGNQGVQQRKLAMQSQQQDMEERKMEAQQRQAKSDIDIHQALLTQGYKPVVNGLVHDDYSDLPGFSAPAPTGGDLPQGVPLPGASVAPTPARTILRPVDSSRTLSFKDHTGADVAYEQPSLREQHAYLLQANAPDRAAAAQQAGDVAQSTAAGKNSADAANLQQNGVDLSPEDAARLGVPAGTRMLRTEVAKLAGQVAPVVQRGKNNLELADVNNSAKGDRQAQSIAAKETIQGRQQNFLDQENMRRLQAQDQWSTQRNAVTQGLSPSLAPIKLRAFDNTKQQWEELNGQADQGLQQVHEAQQVVDPNVTADGEVFTNPFTGLKMTMNPGVRQTMVARASLAQKSVDQARSKADAIAAKAGINPNAPAGASVAAPAPGRPAAPRGAPAAPQGQPQSAGSPIANAVANYQEKMTTALSRVPYGQRKALTNEIMKINPDFHEEYYNNFNKTEQDATTGKIGTSSNALNTMMGHLTVLSEAAKALDNGNVQILNKLANSIGAQTGSTARTTYDTIVHRLGPEVTKAYVASGGSVGERGTNEEDFSSSLGPDQIKRNIGISAQLADSKIKANQEQYNRGTYGRGKQKLISDDAEAARKLLTGQSPVTSGAKAVTTKAERDALPAGAQYTRPGDPTVYTKQ